MNDKLKIAVCQLRTELDMEQTMEKAAAFVRRAAESGADFAVLPEMFNCPYSARYFRRFAAEGQKKTVEAMSAWARENGIYLVGGSVPETEGEKLYNTCYVFDREGRQIAKHRKVHLFDVDIPGMRFRESATFSPGTPLFSMMRLTSPQKASSLSSSTDTFTLMRVSRKPSCMSRRISRQVLWRMISVST